MSPLTVFWVLWAVSLVLGGATGFLLERVIHTCPAASPPFPAPRQEDAGQPPGETPEANDAMAPAPLGVYAESRISMLDDLAPPRLLDVAILLSLWHPDAVDAALVLTARGPLELGRGG